MGNNVKGFDYASKELGKNRIIAGFGGMGGTWREGILTYVDMQSIGKKNTVTIGELNGKKTERLKQLKKLFKELNTKMEISSSINDWLICHGAVITALAGAIYKADCDNYALAKDDKLLLDMSRGVKEVIAELKRKGVKLLPAKFHIIHLMPDALMVKKFRKLLGTKFAEIGLSGHAKVARTEMKTIAETIIKDYTDFKDERSCFYKLFHYI
jgi:2-dehydropantoate 2-reductase